MVNGSERRLAVLALLTMLLMVGCATVPENTGRTASHAMVDTDGTRLGRLEQNQKSAHPGQSGFLPLGNGLDAFLVRAVLAQVAERSIYTTISPAACSSTS